jgi:hypothetical protein
MGNTFQRVSRCPICNARTRRRDCRYAHVLAYQYHKLIEFVLAEPALWFDFIQKMGGSSWRKDPLNSSLWEAKFGWRICQYSQQLFVARFWSTNLVIEMKSMQQIGKSMDWHTAELEWIALTARMSRFGQDFLKDVGHEAGECTQK